MDVTQIVDSLVEVALKTEGGDDARIAAITKAIPEGDVAAVADQVKARYDALASSPLNSTGSDDLTAMLGALADVYTALIPAPDSVQETDASSGEVVPPAPTEARSDEGEKESVVGSDVAVVSASALRKVPMSALTSSNLNTSGEALRGTLRAFAAGDTPDMSAGEPFSSLLDIGRVAQDKLRMLSAGGAGFARTGIVTYKSDDYAIKSGMDVLDVGRVLDQAGDPAKLAFNAKTMTFGGSWCSPSQITYDFCPTINTTDGMVDLPSVTIDRGGLRYPTDPSFADIYSSVGFCFTEEEEQARTEDKPCFRIPCPDFNEIRLDFCGLCIEVSTLQNFAYPEVTAVWLQRAQIAFEHMLNAKALAAMEAKATKSTLTATMPNGRGLIGNVLNTISANASYLRYKHRMNRTQILEVVLPAWVRDMLQADATLRGGVDKIATTFEEIDKWFSVRNLRPQWVYDWQDAYADTNPKGWGGEKAPISWPQTGKILIYPAGTFQLVRQPMVRVSAVKNDPQLLKQNLELALFLEEAWALIDRCPEAIAIEGPLCVTGESTFNTTTNALSCTDF